MSLPNLQFKLIASDFVGLMDSVIIDDIAIEVVYPELFFTSLTTNSSFSIGDSVTVMWDDSSSLPAESVMLSYRTQDNWIEIVTINDGTMEYDWLIPNEPTDDLSLMISGENSYGYSSNNEISGMSIEVVYPELFFTSPTSDSSLGIGDNVIIMWDDSSSLPAESVMLSYRTQDNWIEIVTINDGTMEYDWLIPNEPTDDLSLMISGENSYGYSSNNEISGMSIEVVYPFVQYSIPEPGLIDFSTNEIQFVLSQPLDPNTINTDNILVYSIFSTEYYNGVSYIDSSESIKITFDNPIVSMDSQFQ